MGMRRKTGKATYRLRNWREYNAALIQRGSLARWVSEEALTAWRQVSLTGKLVAPRTHSDAAILCMAVGLGGVPIGAADAGIRL
jgi:hypothetical protein